MKTYLLTYSPKPKSWQWKYRDAAIAELIDKGSFDMRWSISRKRDIKVGERVFLLQQGKQRRGIIGSGKVIGTPCMRRHWNSQKTGKSWYIDVRWEELRPDTDSGPYPREKLNGSVLGDMHWDTFASGNTIPQKVARHLEKQWQSFVRRYPAAALLQHSSLLLAKSKPRSSHTRNPGVNDSIVSAMEGMRTEVTRFIQKRHRPLVEEAKRRANGICAACGRDFKKVLNGKGVRVLQAHHRRQLSSYDEPALTRASDLAVLCANCHSIIHFDPRKPMLVETLRKLLR